MTWKDGAPYVLCLSHDVDRINKKWYHYCFYGIKHPLVQLKSLLYRIKVHDPYWNFKEIMDLEECYGVRSTFFFLNEGHKELSATFMGRYDIESKKVVDIIRELDAKGFEIGLHGSYYSYNDEEMLLHEKQILEHILGHSLISTRQHYLNFDKDKTWNIHKNIGIVFDSTCGYTNKTGDEQPFITEQGLVEIPITLMDTVHMDDEVYDKCCRIADKGGVIVLNFHQCRFNEVDHPEIIKMYKKLLIKAHKEGAWITNIAELGRWLEH